MLHYKAIDKPTLALLKKLQSSEGFSNTRLAGGTSLALQIGHRKSIDIDLFGQIDEDEYTITKKLSSLGKVVTLKNTENIHIYSINSIKVDLVNYPYHWIEQAISEDELILADKKDIAAMKLAAITGRGTKKDFIDLYFLLSYYSLEEMVSFYNQKYTDGSEFLVLKSLAYFEDADQDENPFMFTKLDWNKVKNNIKTHLKDYLETNK
ncbi:MAG: nucleotidyl transferase AbiEii/AbiGii toxin family protein [Bacteroidetes bacterium]|nr:nucleotidyl transferase AbiEii/AbiGii toxin family protein [Bacteroidota bacterium]